MRRSACLLALWGASVHSVFGADPTPFGTPRAEAPGRSASLFSEAPTPAASQTSERYRRSASTQQPGEELRNYYNELFGQMQTGAAERAADALPPTQRAIAPQREAAPGTATANGAAQPFATGFAASEPAMTPAQSEELEDIAYRGRLRPAAANSFASEPAPSAAPDREFFANEPAVGRFSATSELSAADPVSPTPREVIHAEFRPQAGQPQHQVQTVKAERFGAAANPEPAARATAAPSQSSLTDPISIAPPFPQDTSASGGSLNISRSAARAPEAELHHVAAPVETKLTSVPTPAPVTKPVQTAARTASAAPQVRLEWKKSPELNVGQECRCQLSVRNSSSDPAYNLEVSATFPAHVQLVSASPAPATANGELRWRLDELPAGGEQLLEIALIPTERGEIAARAEVRVVSVATSVMPVAEPMLSLHVDGQSQVTVGETTAHTVTVTNPGSGAVSHVQLEALLPEGLNHARGRRLLMELGALNPGETRSVRLALNAVTSGHHQVQVQARSGAGLVRTGAVDIVVVAPSLQARIQGPSVRYVGRQGVYQITVANEGAVATDNVRVMHKIPSGFEFVSSDHGVQYDANASMLNWFVGRLEPGAPAQIKVTLTATQLGEQTHYIRATSEHGALSDAQFHTVVEGASSLALEIKDLEDPVEVGSEMLYEVRVKNDGSAPSRKLGLVCELAPGMRLIDAAGPTEFRVAQEIVAFREIPELAPGESLKFQIKVAATQPGSLRLRARLTSESMAEPLTAEELTRFYGE